MILKIISSLIFGLFIFSYLKYILWLFVRHETNIKKWLMISIISTTIGSYIIMMFIVNSVTFSGSTVTFIFTSRLDILLYVYLSVILFSTALEVIKTSKLPDRYDRNVIVKYFMMFSFTKFISIVLFMSFLIILTI